MVQNTSTEGVLSALLREHMAKYPDPRGETELAFWVMRLVRAAYDAGRAARADEAQELDQITGALRDAPWRQRAELDKAFDAACAEFDARSFVP